jgi:transitional endoplasmic reticulum ATPase
VVVLAATNRPDMIDPALLRPGRFDRMLLVPAPDRPARLAILKVHTKEVPVEGVDLDSLAGLMEGYVGADIEAVVREAALAAMRDDPEAKKVLLAHFDRALAAVRPSADEKTMKYYADLGRELSGGLRRVKDEVAGYR